MEGTGSSKGRRCRSERGIDRSSHLLGELTSYGIWYCRGLQKLLVALNCCISGQACRYYEARTAAIEAGGPVSSGLRVAWTLSVAVTEGTGGVIVEVHVTVEDGVDME